MTTAPVHFSPEVAAGLVASALACCAPIATGFWISTARGATFEERACFVARTLAEAPVKFEVTRTAWYPFGCERGLRIPDTLFSHAVVSLAVEFFAHYSRYFCAIDARFGEAVTLREFRADCELAEKIPRRALEAWFWREARSTAECIDRRLPSIVFARMEMDLAQLRMANLCDCDRY